MMVADYSSTYSNVRITKGTSLYTKYRSPSQITTQYFYRMTLFDIDVNKYSEIDKWCKENCLRRYELQLVNSGNRKWHLVCAFEKKSDRLAAKIMWSEQSCRCS